MFQPLSLNPEAPDAKDRLRRALGAYYFEGDGSLLISEEERSRVQMDGASSDTYIESTINKKQVHEEDFVIFERFHDSTGIILDIGANWGYSVASLWSVAPACRIVSFEPIILYQPTLSRIKQLRPTSFDYFMMGLGAENSSAHFTVPVVNDRALSALTSARRHNESSVDWMAHNILHHCRMNMPNSSTINVGLLEFAAEIRTLDTVISENPHIFDGNRIVAVKIDVEGLEPLVLRGSEALLRSQAPLIMLEGGNRFDGLTEHLQSFGYFYCERRGHKLFAVDGVGQAVNGFFVHERDKSFVSSKSAGN